MRLYMLKKSFKIITILFSVIILMNIFAKNSYASGSFAVNASKKSLTVGETTYLLVSAINSAGKFSISSSDTSIVTVSSNTVFVDGNSMDPNITITAKGVGSATITITAVDVESYDDTPQSITGSKTVTIKVADTSATTTDNESSGSTQSGGATNTSPNNNTSNGNTENKEPTFKAVNETVYAKSTANVRKSYSTSSNKLAQLNVGDSVTRTGIGDNGWSKITYNGQTAYVSTNLLTTEAPASQEEPEEQPEEAPQEENGEQANTEVTPENELENNEEEQQVILGLEDIKIVNYTLKPEFSIDTYEYTLDVSEDINSLDIEAISNDENAEVEILGNEGFVIGENNVTILVTNEDKTETITYTIKVNKIAETTNNNLVKIIVIAIVGVIILVLFFVIKRNANKEKYEEVPLYSMLEKDEKNFEETEENVTEIESGIDENNQKETAEESDNDDSYRKYKDYDKYIVENHSNEYNSLRSGGKRMAKKGKHF